MDVGLSSSASSAAQSGGDWGSGDFIIGGSGGVTKTPTWIFLALGGVGLLLVFWFAFRKK
jgi:hypothetical protein